VVSVTVVSHGYYVYMLAEQAVVTKNLKHGVITSPIRAGSLIGLSILWQSVRVKRITHLTLFLASLTFIKCQEISSNGFLHKAKG
jgi:hypothetical protein